MNSVSHTLLFMIREMSDGVPCDLLQSQSSQSVMESAENMSLVTM